MLGKLIKYEFKATARNLIPLYGVLLLISIINKVFFPIGVEAEKVGLSSSALFNIVRLLSIILYIVVFVVGNVITVIVIVQRFYRNLLMDEGYLMNTLPVKPSMNILSKLVVATVWSIVTAVVSGLSIIILAYNKYSYESAIADIKAFINRGIEVFGAGLYLILFEIILIILLSVILSLLIMYSSMLIGHLFNNHRVLLSFSAFLVINIIFNFLFIFIVGFSNNVLGINGILNEMSKVQHILFLIMGYYFILSTGIFYISSYIIKNKLNLE